MSEILLAFVVNSEALAVEYNCYYIGDGQWNIYGQVNVLILQSCTWSPLQMDNIGSLKNKYFPSLHQILLISVEAKGLAPADVNGFERH